MSGVRAEVAAWAGLTEEEVSLIARSASARYKVYTTPKRSGGTRVIAQPAREVKLLQRFLIDRVWSRFEIHDAATAYKPGASILLNAKAHAGGAAILKLDFVDFFPSFTGEALTRFLNTAAPDLSAEDVMFIVSVSTRRTRERPDGRLTIGAPSSPIITNVMMRAFDAAVAGGLGDGVVYTRYADDITVSASDVESLLAEERRVGEIAAAHETPKLVFKDAKRTLVRVGRQRRVTGLVLADNGAVTLGRERKRRISAAMHQYKLGRLDVEEQSRFQGLLAFALSIEPAFIEKMREKYGSNVVDDALSRQRRGGRLGPPDRPSPATRAALRLGRRSDPPGAARDAPPRLADAPPKPLSRWARWLRRGGPGD